MVFSFFVAQIHSRVHRSRREWPLLSGVTLSLDKQLMHAQQSIVDLAVTDISCIGSAVS